MTHSIDPIHLSELEHAAHGQQYLMPNGDLLTMNTDYPRPSFDVCDRTGEYQGYIYPHHVAEEYAAPDTPTSRHGDSPMPAA